MQWDGQYLAVLGDEQNKPGEGIVRYRVSGDRARKVGFVPFTGSYILGQIRIQGSGVVLTQADSHGYLFSYPRAAIRLA
jgi:hypothetical protein